MHKNKGVTENLEKSTNTLQPLVLLITGEEFVPTWAVPSSTTTLPPIGETVRSIQPGEFGIYLHSLSTIESECHCHDKINVHHYAVQL